MLDSSKVCRLIKNFLTLLRALCSAPSYLIEGFLDLVEVIEVVLHCHTDGVHSMRACQPLPRQQLIQVMLANAMSKSKQLNALESVFKALDPSI